MIAAAAAASVDRLFLLSTAFLNLFIQSLPSRF